MDNDEHPHAHDNDAPGASGPGEPGYEGQVTIGDEGAAPELGEAADEAGSTAGAGGEG